MTDRVLIRTGAAGAIVAAICCATPILAVLLPVLGLGAWLAGAYLVLFALLAGSLGLLSWGLYLRRTEAVCCEAEIHEGGQKP
jgi:mercuric ion transport protein